MENQRGLSNDGGDSPRGLVMKSNSVTNKLRQSLIKTNPRNKLDKLEGMNPLEAYNTIDAGM